LGMPSEGRMPSSGSTSQIAAPRNPNELRLEFPLAGVLLHILVSAGPGNDQITIAQSVTIPSFVGGGERGDWFGKGSGGETVFDFSGDNRIETGNGRDFIAAGGLLPVGNGNNRIDAGAGDDVVITFGGDDSIDAGPGNDLVHAGGGNDFVNGGLGNDILLGEEGNDTLIGGDGLDLLIGGVGADSIVGDQGDDILIAGTTTYDQFNDSALLSILAVWSSGLGYNERVANLSAGLNPPGVQ